MEQTKISATLILVLTLVWVLIMVVILILNLPIGFLFWSSKQLAFPRNMYITSMIVSDILLGVLIPFKIYMLHAVMDVVTATEVLCRGIVVAQCFMVFVGTYSLLALALARHRYITSSRKDFRQTRGEACFIIAFFWLASVLSAFKVPFLAEQYGLDNVCAYPAVIEPNMEVYEVIVGYILPFTTIFVLCGHAQRHLKDLRGSLNAVEGAASRRRDCRVVRMVVLISVFSLLLQLPAKLFPITEYYGQKRNSLMLEIFQLLLFCTGASNIIIYVAFNRRNASMIFTFMKHRGAQVGAMDMSNATSVEQISNFRGRIGTVASTIFRSSRHGSHISAGALPVGRRSRRNTSVVSTTVREMDIADIQSNATGKGGEESTATPASAATTAW